MKETIRTICAILSVLIQITGVVLVIHYRAR